MPALVCLKCRKFLRPKKNGIYIEEGRPTGDGTWASYKLWMADLWACPACGREIVAGFGRSRIAEHFEKDYADQLARAAPICRVDDCGPGP